MLERAYFISHIVNIEQMLTDMMQLANVTEEGLESKKVIHTAFGMDLTRDYLRYVREHPIRWSVPTKILYGSKDNLTRLETVYAFAKKQSTILTVMENGEHCLAAF